VEEQLRAILHCYDITTPPPAGTPPRKVLEKVIGKVSEIYIVDHVISHTDQTSNIRGHTRSHEQTTSV